MADDDDFMDKFGEALSLTTFEMGRKNKAPKEVRKAIKRIYKGKQPKKKKSKEKPKPLYPPRDYFDQNNFMEEVLEELDAEGVSPERDPNLLSRFPDQMRRYYIEMGRTQQSLMNHVDSQHNDTYIQTLRIEPEDRPYLSNITTNLREPLFSHDGYINLTRRELRRALRGGYTASQRGIFRRGQITEIRGADNQFEVYGRNPTTDEQIYEPTRGLRGVYERLGLSHMRNQTTLDQFELERETARERGGEDPFAEDADPEATTDEEDEDSDRFNRVIEETQSQLENQPATSSERIMMDNVRMRAPLLGGTASSSSRFKAFYTEPNLDSQDRRLIFDYLDVLVDLQHKFMRTLADNDPIPELGGLYEYLGVSERNKPYLSNFTENSNPLYSYDGYINIRKRQLRDVLNDAGALNYERGVYQNGVITYVENENFLQKTTMEALPKRSLFRPSEIWGV
tara:strand:- start:231 stop:1592 length:1362 start_codon:yes stop_codon:yes gene_type:complete